MEAVKAGREGRDQSLHSIEATAWLIQRRTEIEPPVNFDFLSRLARVMSELVRIAAWIAAILVAGWLLYRISQRLGWFRSAADTHFS